MEQNTSQLKSSNLDLYKNLQDISAIRFHEVKFTGNIKGLDKNYLETKNYDVKDILILDQKWIELYDEYYQKTADSRYKKTLKNKDTTLKLLLEITVLEKIKGLLEFLSDNEEGMPGEEYIKNITHFSNELRRLKKNLKIDVTKPIKPQLKPLSGYIGGLQSRYEILFKEDLNVEEVDIMRYYEIKAEIASILKMDDIPDYINMLQWIVYENKAKRIIKNGNTRKGASRRNNKGMGRT